MPAVEQDFRQGEKILMCTICGIRASGTAFRRAEISRFNQALHERTGERGRTDFVQSQQNPRITERPRTVAPCNTVLKKSAQQQNPAFRSNRKLTVLKFPPERGIAQLFSKIFGKTVVEKFIGRSIKTHQNGLQSLIQRGLRSVQVQKTVRHHAEQIRRKRGIHNLRQEETERRRPLPRGFFRIRTKQIKFNPVGREFQTFGVKFRRFHMVAEKSKDSGGIFKRRRPVLCIPEQFRNGALRKRTVAAFHGNRGQLLKKRFAFRRIFFFQSLQQSGGIAPALELQKERKTQPFIRRIVQIMKHIILPPCSCKSAAVKELPAQSLRLMFQF